MPQRGDGNCNFEKRWNCILILTAIAAGFAGIALTGDEFFHARGLWDTPEIDFALCRFLCNFLARPHVMILFVVADDMGAYE